MAGRRDSTSWKPDSSIARCAISLAGAASNAFTAFKLKASVFELEGYASKSFEFQFDLDGKASLQ